MLKCCIIGMFFQFMQCTATGQSISNDLILKTFLTDSSFCPYVLPACSKKCDSIFVIDTGKLFKDKGPFVINNRVVSITNEDLDKVKPGMAIYLRKSENRIQINRIAKAGDVFSIHYYQATTNGVGFISYKVKEGRLVKVDSQFGQL